MTGSTPATPIKIDLWTDIVCPWCYVGEARLQKAIELEGLEGHVQIQTHSFELDPTAPAESAGETSIGHLEKKLGKSATEVLQMEQQIAQMAADVDMPYETDRPMANTRRVHRLVQVAAEYNLHNELFRKLQHGYFANTIEVFDTDALITAAAELGVPEDRARRVLESDEGEDLVAQDISVARELGVTGVPFMVLDRKYAIPGAIQVDQYRQALRTLVDESNRTEPEGETK